MGVSAMGLISSRSNPKIKQARLLRDKKGRQVSGLALVEGIHPVGEAAAAAVKGHVQIVAIYYAPALLKSDFGLELVAQQAGMGVPCHAVTEEVIQSISDKEHPQGIVAIVRPSRYSLADLSAEDFPWGVALVSPQDAGNVGSIVRTIDAVGASGLILLENAVDAYHPNAVRASMGTLFWYPIVVASFSEFHAWLNREGYHLYGTSAHAQVDYRQIDYRQPCILLMGSEREGLTTEQQEACEIVIRLPMRGRASSLNLAVATGVMLYAMADRMGTR